MAKATLDADTQTRVYTSANGTFQAPTVVDFRIDPDAAEGTQIAYALTASGEAVFDGQGNPSGSNDPTTWMPLLLNEIGSVTLRLQDSLVLYSVDGTDVYFTVSGSK